MSAKQRVPELPSLLPMNRGWCPIQRSVDDAEGQSARIGAGTHRGRRDRRRLREGRDLDAQRPVVPMPPPDPRLELRARKAARTGRDLDPRRAHAGLVSVELERQPGEDAAVRVVAVDARADDALAADRSGAADGMPTLARSQSAGTAVFVKTTSEPAPQATLAAVVAELPLADHTRERRSGHRRRRRRASCRRLGCCW